MSSRSQDDNVFKALAHPRRREMLDQLKDEAKTTGMLCDAFPAIDRCTFMLHLKVLEEADLVVARVTDANAGTISTRCRSGGSMTAGSASMPAMHSASSTG
jgi:hypothetical protein